MLSALAHTMRSSLSINVQLDLTNACNLNCRHCYHPHHSNDGVLSTAQWLSALNRIEDLLSTLDARPRFFLCGGEPTLSTSFLPVLEKIKEKFPNAWIGVLTNGTTPEHKVRSTEKDITVSEAIRECGACVQVSLDGATEKSHDSLRGSGAFVRTIAGIVEYRKKGIPVNLLSVLHSGTAREISSFFDLTKQINAQAMNFVRFIPTGEGKRLLLQKTEVFSHLVGEKLHATMVDILQNSQRTGVPTGTRGALWAVIDSRLGSADRLGFFDIIVDYQGYLKVSSRTPIRIGHVLHDDLWSVLRKNPILKKLRSGAIEGCRDCVYFKRKRCSGDRNFAFSISGNFLSPDFGCWIWSSKRGAYFENKNSINFRWTDPSWVWSLLKLKRAKS